LKKRLRVSIDSLRQQMMIESRAKIKRSRLYMDDIKMFRTPYPIHKHGRKVKEIAPREHTKPLTTLSSRAKKIIKFS
jgi:hypothetical protein